MELVDCVSVTRIKLYFTGTSVVKVSRKSSQAIFRTVWSAIWTLSHSSGLLVARCPPEWQVRHGEEEPQAGRRRVDGSWELLKNAKPLASGNLRDGRRHFLFGV